MPRRITLLALAIVVLHIVEALALGRSPSGTLFGNILQITASFAATYAMGKAAGYFLLRRRQGIHAEEVASVYRKALQQAFGLARNVGPGFSGERS